MMMPNHIMNFHVQRNRVPLTIDNGTFHIRKSGKLINFIVKILKKLNMIESKLEYDWEITANKIEIDLVNLGYEIRKEMDYYQSQNISIERIIMGRDHFEAFLKGQLDTHFDIPSNGYVRSYLGVRVQLNPYISGIVFLPSEKW